MKEKSSWRCGKCDLEAGMYPGGEPLPEHDQHCEKYKCRDCDNPAKFSVKTPFGTTYRCGVHVKKFQRNMFAIVNRLE